MEIDPMQKASAESASYVGSALRLSHREECRAVALGWPGGDGRNPEDTTSVMRRTAH